MNRLPLERAGTTPAAALVVLMGLLALWPLTNPGRGQGLLGSGDGGTPTPSPSASAAPVAVVAAPSARRVRKDAQAMTRAERTAFRDAVYAFMARAASDPANYDQYIEMHRYAGRHGHSGPAFLPWHRAMLKELEDDLGVAIPYWDWTRPAPRVFSDELFGGDGAVTFGTTGRTITREAAANFDVATEAPVTAATVNGDLSQTSYLAFWRPFEGTHGEPHWKTGGPLGSVPTAVQDPLFFLLHSNVDRLWWQWQQRRKAAFEADPANRGRTYDPKSDYWDGTRASSPFWDTRHKIDSLMWPWDGSDSGGSSPFTMDRYRASPKNYTPEQFFDIAALGYEYQ